MALRLDSDRFKVTQKQAASRRGQRPDRRVQCQVVLTSSDHLAAEHRRPGFMLPPTLVGAVIACTAMIFSACRPGAPQDDGRVAALEATLVAEREQVEQTIATLEAEVARLLAENTELRERVEHVDLVVSDERTSRLESRVAQLEVELRRYKRGLEKAVDTLNAQQSPRAEQTPRATVARASSPSAPPTTPTLADRRPCCVIHDPHLRRSETGSAITISGEIYNAAVEAVSGWAIVELFADGELAASERVELEIEPGARATYSVTFAAMFEGPGYLPRVRFEES